ncbi:MAG: hypothetical protein ACUVWN_17900 [bacterium]
MPGISFGSAEAGKQNHSPSIAILMADTLAPQNEAKVHFLAWLLNKLRLKASDVYHRLPFHSIAGIRQLMNQHPTIATSLIGMTLAVILATSNPRLITNIPAAYKSVSEVIQAVDTLLTPSADARMLAEDKWEQKKDLPFWLDTGAACVVNDKLYIIGGFQGAWAAGKTILRYNQITDTWKEIVQMPIVS